MIIKTLAVTLCLFGIHYVFAMSNPEIGIATHQGQDNVVKAEEYIYSPADTVVLGTSLAGRILYRDSLPTIQSIAFGGSSPEIVNSDQGSQYTTKAWEDLLTGYGIQVSMDGRGRCKDNIWIERFWRSIKQDYIYLNPAETVTELREGISNYIKFYNYERPHQTLNNLPPASFYDKSA